MTAEIIQFIPRSIPKPVAIRTWPDPTPLECMAIDIVNQIFPSDEADTAPSEYNHQADEKDGPA